MVIDLIMPNKPVIILAEVFHNPTSYEENNLPTIIESIHVHNQIMIDSISDQRQKLNISVNKESLKYIFNFIFESKCK